MAQAAEKVLEFPSGGIADFYMEDDDVASLEREEAKKAFGNNGIANFSDVANRMASYGRGGDDTLAHVATGEIVIPLPLIDNNPEMKASIFKHLEELGVEDPEQYVVGSSANSINPETGLREFGWLSKTIRKVTRGVKKAVKSVVKVVKKAAPVIIPFALNALFPGMGAIYQGALGAGIGTLVQGGSLKDAFKSALIGGAIGGAVEGVKGALPGGKGAMASIKDAAKFSRLQEASTQLTTGQFGQSGLDAVRASAPSASLTSDQFAADTAVSGQQPNSLEAFREDGLVSSKVGLNTDAGAPLDTPAGASSGVGSNLSTDVATEAYKPRSFLENIQSGEFKEAFLPSGPTPDQVQLAQAKKYTDALSTYGVTPATASAAQQTAAAAEAAKVTAASLGPGMMGYLPLAGVGLATTAALGAFEKPEEEEDEGLGPTGADLLAQYRDKYGNTPVGQRLSEGPYRVATRFPSRFPPIQPVADGGEIFPRRVGGIMPDEGVPGKDSVRAMLMPGEFVMTTDAVKGLGGGNNDQGIKNMYDMMRGLEAKGRAIA